MKPILKEAWAHLQTSLKRKAISDCAKWATTYRRIGPNDELWSFEKFPWLEQMHKSKAEMKIGMKCAQIGYTETALNITFYEIDINKRSVLYVLPTFKPDASDFSTSRFDPALEASEHLRNLFTDVKNQGHKRAGNASLYVRGSRSRSHLKSIPVGLVILDELDEMCAENIPMIFERMSGQEIKNSFLISTPTIEGHGIHNYYKESNQSHYFFRCPHCSRLTELIFPDCLVVTAESATDKKIFDSHIICKECKAKLEHKDKVRWLKEGKWVPQNDNSFVEGYHINQLYSMFVEPYQIATLFIRARYDPIAASELYNSKMGLCYTVEGAKITEKDIRDCIGSYLQTEKGTNDYFITMGVDVGKWLHVEIGLWYFDKELQSLDVNLQAKYKILKALKVQNFEDLDRLMLQYKVNFCVIDANPERRKAVEFSHRFYGRVKLCFYVQGMSPKQINIHETDENTLSLDRTSWMDAALGRFKNQTIQIPQDISQEYREHIKVPTRVYRKDRQGNSFSIYVSGDKDDHYSQARTYSEIALKIGLSVMNNSNITGVI